ncbi:MarR family winged helix-turn-helix transcriptional regulator [Acidovorax sp. BL-A-41-H1]|uniref:MarR family winged helix-turn-helix transcriptional regulator n=1 Tax=Acidovorax sp. BL-A-41-H1 TaxID=3421102 RepID=UPI003F7AF177
MARRTRTLPDPSPVAPAVPDSGSEPSVEAVDTRFLRTLVGYNTRRASLSIIGVFMERMAVYDLKVVDFSVLSLVAHNPGITSRQLCATLNVLPPNLVGLIAALERRGLIERRPHPSDGRAMGVHLTPAGVELTGQAEQTAAQLEQDATARLTAAERKTLIRLLQKVYD